jgi:hypothetical protein
VSGICRKSCRQAKRGDMENAETKIHFITSLLRINFVQTSYRIARASVVVKLSQAAHNKRCD